MHGWVDLLCPLLGETIMNWMDWARHRLCEPSTWAGMGCALVGLGIICQSQVVVFVGMAVGGLAILVRETGKK